MTFKLYKEYGASSRRSITLRISGMLFISRHVLNKIEAPLDSADIYIDEDAYAIGIKFRDDEQGRKLNSEKSGVSISILSPLRFLGIKNHKKVNFDLIFDNGMIILNLKELK